MIICDYRQISGALGQLEEVLVDSSDLFVTLSDNLELAAPVLSEISQALEKPQVQEFLSECLNACFTLLIYRYCKDDPCTYIY